jgi:hypothetical protein
VLRSPFPEGDVSLCLIAVAPGDQRSWSGNSFQAWIILATQGERALVSTVATKQFCAQTKVRSAIDWQSIPWWWEGSPRLCESEWNVFETWSEWEVPVCGSVNMQATTYRLMTIHVHLVGGLYWPAYCQVAPPTGYRPMKESVGDEQSMWGSVKDTSRKLGRLSIYWAFSPTR